MKVKLLAGVAMAGLFAAGVANAEPNGWYGAVDAGYHTIDTIETYSSRTGQLFDFEVQDDWAAFARLGYRFDQNWRVELEGGYRSNDIESIGNPNPGLPTGVCAVGPVAGPCGTPDGEISAASLMMNVIYDFGDASWSLRPFIGLGLGMNRVNTEFLGTYAVNRVVAIGADDSSTELAAQAIADYDAGRAAMVFPTWCNMHRLAQYQTLAHLFERVSALPAPYVQPAFVTRDGEPWLTIPEGIDYPVTGDRVSNMRRE